MGTMKMPRTSEVLKRPHSMLVVVLSILFYFSFAVADLRIAFAAIGVVVCVLAFGFVGRNTDKGTRFLERANMALFFVVFLQMVTQ